MNISSINCIAGLPRGCTKKLMEMREKQRGVGLILRADVTVVPNEIGGLYGYSIVEIKFDEAKEHPDA